MIRLKVKKQTDESISLEAIEGIDHFGFGTFLCNIQPEEIEADEFSKDALISGREKRGLNDLEVWEDNRIAWGHPNHKVIVEVNQISKMKGSDEWLKEIKTTP